MTNSAIKKATVVVLALCIIPVSYIFAQQVFTADQKTVYWDPNPSLEGLSGTFTYEVYTISQGADKENQANWTFIGDTPGFAETVTFTVEGTHVVGVRTKRLLPDGETVVMSEMNWSDENGVNTPEPFVILYVEPPDPPTNLRQVQ